jgi:hypothetical protein
VRTFRIFFVHGQALDYQAETCELRWPSVTLRDAEGNKVVRYHDSDIVAVREIKDPAI